MVAGIVYPVFGNVVFKVCQTFDFMEKVAIDTGDIKNMIHLNPGFECFKNRKQSVVIYPVQACLNVFVI